LASADDLDDFALTFLRWLRGAPRGFSKAWKKFSFGFPMSGKP
jgi:hypothetical protein